MGPSLFDLFVIAVCAIGALVLPTSLWLARDTLARYVRAVLARSVKSAAPPPAPAPIAVPPLGNAAEGLGKDALPAGAERFPHLARLLDELTDAELLEVLARMKKADGYRWAPSRVADFIPGRTADNLEAVRLIREVPKPPPPGRMLTVRENGAERLIPM